MVPLGEGLDNTAYEINGELVLRVAKETDPARIDREARLLAAVAEISPVPVPRPTFVAAQAGWLAYPKLPGIPLIQLPATERARHAPRIAATLADLLGALHAVPVSRMAGLAELDLVPAEEWWRETAQIYAGIVAAVTPGHRRAVEEFLRTPPPPGPETLVFSHHDLGIEHVLVDPRSCRVTGVIDWSDAAITDPAHDYGLVYRDLGTLTVIPADLRQRSIFYARCGVFEDLAYGLEGGKQTYIDKCLTSLDWLFPA